MAPYVLAEVNTTMFFSDLHVQLLSRGILNPGEQLLGQTATSYVPWWAMGLIQRQYLVLATDQRLILVDHRLQFFPLNQKLHQVESIPWAQVSELKVSGIFKKKLKVKGTGDRGPVSHKHVIPNALFGLLAPMANNMQGAKQIASQFLAQKQLGGGSMAPQLGAAPVSQHYGAPQQSYGAPQQSYGAPQQSYGAPPQAAYGAPAQPYGQPVINAPGYNSVPPPAPHQAVSPFDMPRQY